MKCEKCGKQLGIPSFKELKIDVLCKQYVCQHCSHQQWHYTENHAEIDNYKVFHRDLPSN